MKEVFKDIVFLAAKRTPFGTFLGTLKNVSATDLAIHASNAAFQSSGVKPEQVNHVVFGQVIASSQKDGIYSARHIGLKSGVPVPVPAFNVNRLCGSGFQAIVDGAQLLALGQAECVLVGGTENMSQAPHIIRGGRSGIPLGQGALEDALWDSLTDTYVKAPMGVTAENLATKYNISQQEVDEFSVRSQKLAAEATAKGYLADEIAPIDVKQGKKTVTFSKDEHIRGDATVEGFARLPRVFKKDGVVHAGAASGICDGAAALIMSTRQFADKHGITPIGRFVNFGIAGCDPSIMGIGPVPATKIALERSGANINDFDLIEVNEAFAPQALAVQKELKIPTEKFNTQGGAIAIGHPLGASGARLTTHLLHALKRQGGKYGLGSACIGGGQGITVIVEAL